MRRKCTDSLIYWKKNPGRKPLILQGLRQTGKTWLLMDFGNKQYEHTLYINLETDRSATDYLSVPHDPQEVLLFLETCAGKPLRPASSLLTITFRSIPPRPDRSSVFSTERTNTQQKRASA